jgi:hypothetical protein
MTLMCGELHLMVNQSTNHNDRIMLLLLCRGLRLAWLVQTSQPLASGPCCSKNGVCTDIKKDSSKTCYTADADGCAQDTKW